MDFDNQPDDITRDESTNIISVLSKYDNTCKGLGYEFFKSMQQNKHKIAQYIADTGEEDTYDSLLKRSVRTALHLKAKNLTKNDIVCLCSYNQIHSSVPFIACLFLGIKVVSLDPSFTTSDATHLISLVKPRLFFIVPEVIDMITTSLKNADIDAELVVYGENVGIEKFTPFSTFLKEHNEENNFNPVEITDVSETAAIFFSSGTTGLPKGICISHKTIYHQGYQVINMGIVNSNSVVLLFSTLYWVSAVFNLSACIFSGSARLVCKTFEPDKLWKLLEKYKVTYCFFTPVQTYYMISAGRPKGINTSQLYVIMIGGASFAKDKMNEIRNLLPETFVCQCYGCTEFCGYALVFNMAKTKDKLLLQHRPTSSGRPVTGFQYRVVDLETEDNCGPNKRGELRIKSEFNTIGYYNQASSSAFDSEGWLRTGDIVYYDEDLCFYIIDRIKEMLKYRSWHVTPAVLEQILQTHPAVSQSVVIGIPHEVDGDHPMALILLNKNYTKGVTPEEIERFVAERVNDTHKLRGGVKFLETLPVSATGKVRKNHIRDMVLKGLL